MMNSYQLSMRYRAVKHGSEEEYDLFKELAVCQARNRRMHSAAESKLQFSTLEVTGEVDVDTAANTQHTSNEHPPTDDSAICTGDGKLSQAKDTTNCNEATPEDSECDVRQPYSLVCSEDKPQCTVGHSPSICDSSDDDPCEEEGEEVANLVSTLYLR